MHILALVVPYVSCTTFVSLLCMSRAIFSSYLLRVRMDKSRHYEYRSQQEFLASVLYGEEVALFIQEGPRRRYLNYPFLPARVIFYREHLQLFQDIYRNLWLVVGEDVSRWPKAQRVTRTFVQDTLVVYYLNAEDELWLLTCTENGVIIHSYLRNDIALFDVGHRYCIVVDKHHQVLFIEHDVITQTVIDTSIRIQPLLTLPTTVVSCSHIEHDDILLLTLATEEGWRHHYTYYNEQLNRLSVVPHRKVWRADLAQKILHNSLHFDNHIIHVACDDRSNFVIIARR